MNTWQEWVTAAIATLLPITAVAYRQNKKDYEAFKMETAEKFHEVSERMTKVESVIPSTQNSFEKLEAQHEKIAEELVEIKMVLAQMQGKQTH